jgi:hypothetical protein
MSGEASRVQPTADALAAAKHYILHFL